MTEALQPLDSQGWTATIYYLPLDPPRICKAFNKDHADQLYTVEKAAYERFTAHGHPDSIPRFYGTHETIPKGVILEFAENKDVFHYRYRNSTPSDTVLYRWARQAAEALEFSHSVDIFNSDVHPINFLLDRDLNLKVADWAGASIDGSTSYSSYRPSYRLMKADGTDVARAQGITVTTEIFALGTAIYYMVTGSDPWPDLHDREQVKSRIIAGDFPDTNQLRVLGSVIGRCWRVEFASMKDVKLAVEAEEAVRTQGKWRLEAIL